MMSTGGSGLLGMTTPRTHTGALRIGPHWRTGLLLSDPYFRLPSKRSTSATRSSTDRDREWSEEYI